jgi:hypothetical protein
VWYRIAKLMMAYADFTDRARRVFINYAVNIQSYLRQHYQRKSGNCQAFETGAI